MTDANGTTLTANDNIYTTSSSAINISLSADDGYTLRKFLTKVTAGICKQKVAYTADTRTYTYTFYDIHSDLWLDNIQAEAGAAGTSPASPNVGDYFMRTVHGQVHIPQIPPIPASALSSRWVPEQEIM